MKSKYKKISYIFFLIIVIFCIKIIYFSKLFSEYHDLLSFLAHKFYLISKDISILGYVFFISSDFIKNIEDSVFFSLYILESRQLIFFIYKLLIILSILTIFKKSFYFKYD